VFNAQVCNLRGRLLKQADLDLTLDGEKLTQAARAAGENFYVLYENDPSPFWKARFDTDAPGPCGRGLVDADPSEDEDLFLPMNSVPWRRRSSIAAAACGRWKKPASLLCDLRDNPAWGAVATCPEPGRSTVGHPPKGFRPTDEKRGFHG